ncbi:hypothetical protein [Streptomyces sp. NPDC005017]|uniref:hypothetical protein n=1 Tax=Streptomyces sp. NPDC005017 TaxID=3364706 RepID=UPI00367C0126
MVDTMALLPPFRRAARISRPPARVPHPVPGLPADDEVLLDAPDDRLGPALVGAGRGDFAPAALLLAGTRARGEWELRDRYVVRLAFFAHARPEWFQAWRAASPLDPDALLVGAQLAVDRVWGSPARAELLREVSPAITATAHGDHRDPVPWRLALDHARGTRAGHKYFGELWEAAVRRAPHHYGCHVAALRYLAASYHGSHAECFDFADRAAQDAPPDSLVQALPVRAAFAYLADGCGPEVPRARLDAAADRAVALSARFPAADPWPAQIRNLLACVLVRLDRYADALDQLRQTGPYATSFPWDRAGEEPLGVFLRVRAGLLAGGRAVELGGAGHPHTGHAGRARSADH